MLSLVVVLAGGSSIRLGHDKLSVDLGGRTVLDRLVSNLSRALPGVPILAVGPTRRTRDAVRWVREEPPGGGPVAGLAYALTAQPVTEHDLVAVLAGDLPFGAAALPVLREAAAQPEPADAWLAAGPDGRAQPLLGLYRYGPLHAALVGQPAAGRSMRSVLAGLRVRHVPLPDRCCLDIDTARDVELARAALAVGSGHEGDHDDEQRRP